MECQKQSRALPNSVHHLQPLNALSLSLQRQQDGYSRLKRVCLIGDHNQLPPVVKNMAFQKYSHLDQSLFARFVRLGMPYVQLNAQVCHQGWTMLSTCVQLHIPCLCSPVLIVPASPLGLIRVGRSLAGIASQ